MVNNSLLIEEISRYMGSMIVWIGWINSIITINIFLIKKQDLYDLPRMYDQADISCLVDNEEGENMASTNLDVNYAPTILLHPR